jgi:hypothetical protein
MTLEELKALYAEKGAMQQRVTPSEQGDIVDYIPIQYGEGWFASDAAPEIIGYQPGAGGGEGGDLPVPIYSTDKKLGGFAKQEGDYVYNYDPEGNFTGRTKWNENMLKSTIQDLGPLAMAALTFGGGAGMLGNALFGLEGAAASGAGGALAGGINAYGNDQDILKGALLGAVSGAGAQTIGDTGIKISDVKKAIDFAQNPTLSGAFNAASSYVPTSFDIGDTGYTTSDVIKGLNTAQALSSGNYNQIFNAITGLAKGADTGALSSAEQDQIAQNREAKRLRAIEDAVLNQPASDDGTTQGIEDLIRSMYPGLDAQGMSEGDMAKFLEANLGDIQGSADLETLLKAEGKPTTDEGTVNVTGNREVDTNLTLPTTRGNVTLPNNPEELVITDKRDGDYVPSIRSKEIKSDIPNEITVDQIDRLFPDANINDILQLITPTVPGTKVTPSAKVTPSTPKTTEQLMANLGLNIDQASPSQDPYANIKSMEDVFGGDIAYKLRALGAPRNLASTDLDALARLLRNQNV